MTTIIKILLDRITLISAPKRTGPRARLSCMCSQRPCIDFSIYVSDPTTFKRDPFFAELLLFAFAYNLYQVINLNKLPVYGIFTGLDFQCIISAKVQNINILYYIFQWVYTTHMYALWKRLIGHSLKCY